MQADRKSNLRYLAARVPDARTVVQDGFSFFEREDAEILDIWDDLWRFSEYYEVMAAALEYYGHRMKKEAGKIYWPVMRGWSERVENWAPADGLA